MAASLPFDQRDGDIWLNGEFVPWSSAQLHVLSHALHYASSVFEGERAYGGEIFKLTEHTERLFRSARPDRCIRRPGLFPRHDNCEFQPANSIWSLPTMQRNLIRGTTDRRAKWSMNGPIGCYQK